MKYYLRKTNRRLAGELNLAGSKSISNRVLIIQALSGEQFEIRHLANAKDTRLLKTLLESESDRRDAGAAGTTFRFLTAYLSMQPGIQLLTGTERMKQRPIGILVDALRQLGARIEYEEKEGYPPLRIHAPEQWGKQNQLQIPANTSSQYISALLMIAPTLPDGLALNLTGEIVSRPYIEMTLGLMGYFGVSHQWEGQVIRVPPQAYRPRPFRVEADWSAASYYYAMAAFAESADLQLNGLYADSLQGDSVLWEMMTAFGVSTSFHEHGIHLSRSGQPSLPAFDWDFLRCPDLAQTLAVVCGGMGVRGRFTGLETLRIKETDRIDALQRELAKVQVRLRALAKEERPRPDREFFEVSGQAAVVDCPIFATYEDHRMAMAFAPLAMLGEIAVEEPLVVDKSYPDFWEDLKKLEFSVHG